MDLSEAAVKPLLLALDAGRAARRAGNLAYALRVVATLPTAQPPTFAFISEREFPAVGIESRRLPPPFTAACAWAGRWQHPRGLLRECQGALELRSG